VTSGTRPSARRLEEVFDGALDRTGDARRAFLDEACAGEPELRREVEALLSADARPAKTPVAVVASGLAEVAALAPTMPVDDAARAQPTREDPTFVDRFEVKRRLGEGGMGVVYEAYDARLDRLVALKLVRLDAPAARARLHREAQAMAKVEHPNVVAIHEVGVFGDEVFVAMELVRGETLAAWQSTGARSFKAKLAMYVEAGKGLAAAHAAGVVHRDFKPDNVLVGRDGRPRVVDFGLARARGAAPIGSADASAIDAPNLRAHAPRLTAEGAVLGTPAFMSPEHFRGDDVGEQSDQWSFAVALFAALFGRPPFAGETVSELRAAVLAGPRVVAPRAADVPDEVARALERALERDAARRFPSMRALLAELERPLTFDAEHDRARGRTMRRAAAALLLAAGAASLVAVDRVPSISFTPEGLLRLGWFGLGSVVLVGAVFRRAILATAYNRKIAAMFAAPVAGFVVHRALGVSLGETVPQLLAGDGVSLAVVSAMGAVAIDRWLAFGVPAALGFAAFARARPDLAAPAFGALLLLDAAACIWLWGDRGQRPGAVDGENS
jgi:serine/threonine-protein kinase